MYWILEVFKHIFLPLLYIYIYIGRVISLKMTSDNFRDMQQRLTFWRCCAPLSRTTSFYISHTIAHSALTQQRRYNARAWFISPTLIFGVNNDVMTSNDNNIYYPSLDRELRETVRKHTEFCRNNHKQGGGSGPTNSRIIKFHTLRLRHSGACVASKKKQIF